MYVYGLRYDPVGNTVQKRTGTTTWATILTDIDLYGATNLWHYFKFVCDLNTGYYSRLIINEQEYDLADEIALVDTVDQTPHIEFRFTVRGSSDTAGVAYLDDLIITRGEP